MFRLKRKKVTTGTEKKKKKGNCVEWGGKEVGN